MINNAGKTNHPGLTLDQLIVSALQRKTNRRDQSLPSPSPEALENDLIDNVVGAHTAQIADLIPILVQNQHHRRSTQHQRVSPSSQERFSKEGGQYKHRLGRYRCHSRGGSRWRTVLLNFIGRAEHGGGKVRGPVQSRGLHLPCHKPRDGEYFNASKSVPQYGVLNYYSRTRSSPRVRYVVQGGRQVRARLQGSYHA